jgi:hypothetical protein
VSLLGLGWWPIEDPSCRPDGTRRRKARQASRICRANHRDVSRRSLPPGQMNLHAGSGLAAAKIPDSRVFVAYSMLLGSIKARSRLPHHPCGAMFKPSVATSRLETCYQRVRCTRLTRVAEILPAADADAAQWLLRSDVDWWDLVRYGPPGFDVYVRIAFPEDSGAYAGNPSGEAPDDAVRASLAALGSYTTTPSKGYAAVWEGWVSGDPVPRAPRVKIPNRTMLLFTGPVDALRDAPALAWYGSAAGDGTYPHLVWPEDQAWCLACEVDEEIEFTVGCSGEAAQALARVLPGDVRQVRYGEPAPLYRDPP